MLQRIQTVFLMLVALFMLLTFFFPLWTSVGEDGQILNQLFTLRLDQLSTETGELVQIYFPYSIVATLAVASATIAIVEITKFNNRLLQMKMGALNSIFMATTMGVGVYYATDLIKLLNVSGKYGIALFLPAAAMICNVLANRFIKRDDRLVKSVDRIR
jgi:glucan phosphoethanolaminetransferase (alkaline phosphatase superfamily)